MVVTVNRCAALVSLVVLAGIEFVPVDAVAQTPGLPCAATRIAKIVMPVGPSRVAGGRMTLRNGAILELAGAAKSPDMYRVSQMHAGDRVAACYGGLTRYADAGPSRTITILDLANGQYYGTLIGTWSR